MNINDKIDSYEKDIKTIKEFVENSQVVSDEGAMIFSLRIDDLQGMVDYLKELRGDNVTPFPEILKYPYKFQDESEEHKQLCRWCKNDTYFVYNTNYIEDSRIYCTKCKKEMGDLL